MTDQPNKKVPVVAGQRGLVIDNMDSMWRLAQAVAAAPDMRPKAMDTPEKCMVAIQYGMELGMKPMQAINSIAVISGKPTVYGEALIAVANASGLIKNVIEVFEETAGGLTAKCTIIRKDGRETTGEFSAADAKKAGLFGKAGPWSSYTNRMLMWRARGFAYRDSVPEALRGLWFREEAEDIPMHDVTPAPKEPPQERDPLLISQARNGGGEAIQDSLNTASDAPESPPGNLSVTDETGNVREYKKTNAGAADWANDLGRTLNRLRQADELELAKDVWSRHESDARQFIGTVKSETAQGALRALIDFADGIYADEQPDDLLTA